MREPGSITAPGDERRNTVNTLLRTVLRDGVYSVLRRLPLKVTVALALVALALLVSVSGARAAELAYAELSASVTVTSATQASPTDLISAGAISFDGTTRVLVEGYAAQIDAGAAAKETQVDLWDGATNLGAVGGFGLTGSSGVYASIPFRFAKYVTPSAGSHTFRIAGWRVTGANWSFVSGTYYGTVYAPAFIRVSREPVDGAPGAAGDSTSCGSVGQPTCAVALGAGDRDRLDLAWWGIWGMVGLILVLLVAPSFSSFLRVTRGM